MKRRARRAQFPCIDVCRLDAKTGWCLGSETGSSSHRSAEAGLNGNSRDRVPAGGVRAWRR
ncbi:MAG: DUF1289 domain-containing protein [Proteobacteria bacterium]|nr:DUF1289 domain-containing protein [Pseudomonadota bacterium]